MGGWVYVRGGTERHNKVVLEMKEFVVTCDPTTMMLVGTECACQVLYLVSSVTSGKETTSYGVCLTYQKRKWMG